MVATPDPVTGTPISSSGWGHNVYLDLLRLSNLGVMAAIGPAGITGSTSASYVDVSGTSMNWTKQGGATDTDIALWMSISGFTSVSATNIKYGIKVGATDYDVILARYNTANQHQSWSAGRKITGVGAGTLAINIRILRVSGTGTLEVSTDDTAFIAIAEVPK